MFRQVQELELLVRVLWKNKQNILFIDMMFKIAQIKGSMTHLKNIVVVLKRNTLIVTSNTGHDDKLWNHWIQSNDTMFDFKKTSDNLNLYQCVIFIFFIK